MASARYPIDRFGRALRASSRPQSLSGQRGPLATTLGGTLDARERRLSRFAASPKLDLEALREVHLKVLSRLLPRRWRIPLYADLSDIAKPYAKTLEALDVVRDGSDPDKKLQPGYWLPSVLFVRVDPKGNLSGGLSLRFRQVSLRHRPCPRRG